MVRNTGLSSASAWQLPSSEEWVVEKSRKSLARRRVGRHEGQAHTQESVCSPLSYGAYIVNVENGAMRSLTCRSLPLLEKNHLVDKPAIRKGKPNCLKRRRVNCKPVLHRPVETARLFGKLAAPGMNLPESPF